MDFRSHLSRPMDFRIVANLAIGGICVLAAVVAVILWLDGAEASIVFAPVYTFLVWALVREIDPDHNWSALAAASFTATWVLLGEPISSGFAIAGLMLMARIVTSTTGRRPLPVDLVIMTIFGIAIGFGVAGWVAGFGIAIGLYIENRLGDRSRLGTVAAAAVTAIGTTVVATAADVFPDLRPDIVEWVIIAAGVTALVLIVRDPAPPISQVDARHAAFIDQTRLHTSRSLLGCVVFVMSILTGEESIGLVAVIVAMVLVVISNEIELQRRRRL